jgi:hypothetical protein
MARDLFQAICVRVADEKDPEIIELFKQRLRLLLLSEQAHRSVSDTQRLDPI